MSDGGRVQFDDLELGNNRVMMSQGRPFTGVAYETNTSGKVIGEASFLDGIRRGVAREWLESGQLVSEAHYDFGVRHGGSRTWHTNGQIASDADYRFSIKTAEKAWSADGSLVKDWSLPEDDEQRNLIVLLEKRFGVGKGPGAG